MRTWRVLGAGEEIVLHIDHVGEGLGVIPHPGHVHDAADVDAAVADEHPDPGEFFRDRSLLPGGVSLTRVLRPASRRAASAGPRGRGRGLHDRIGDVLGPLHGAAHVNAGPGGGHRRKAVVLTKPRNPSSPPPGVGPAPERPAPLLHAHRQDHHVEDLILHLALFVHIADFQAVDPGLAARRCGCGSG